MNIFRKRLNEKGFTLIELIVVIAILAILALIAIPRLAGFTESARQATDEEIAAIVASAASMYASSHAGETGFTDASVTIANLASDNLITKAYTAADLVSTRYDSITLSYTSAGGPVVTLGTSDTSADYVISK